MSQVPTGESPAPFITHEQLSRLQPADEIEVGLSLRDGTLPIRYTVKTPPASNPNGPQRAEVYIEPPEHEPIVPLGLAQAAVKMTVAKTPDITNERLLIVGSITEVVNVERPVEEELPPPPKEYTPLVQGEVIAICADERSKQLLVTLAYGKGHHITFSRTNIENGESPKWAAQIFEGDRLQVRLSASNVAGYFAKNIFLDAASPQRKAMIQKYQAEQKELLDKTEQTDSPQAFRASVRALYDHVVYRGAYDVEIDLTDAQIDHVNSLTAQLPEDEWPLVIFGDIEMRDYFKASKYLTKFHGQDINTLGITRNELLAHALSVVGHEPQGDGRLALYKMVMASQTMDKKMQLLQEVAEQSNTQTTTELSWLVKGLQNDTIPAEHESTLQKVFAQMLQEGEPWSDIKDKILPFITLLNNRETRLATLRDCKTTLIEDIKALKAKEKELPEATYNYQRNLRLKTLNDLADCLRRLKYEQQ